MQRSKHLSEYQQLRRCLNLFVANPEHRQLLLKHVERTISETVALREKSAKGISEQPKLRRTSRRTA